LLNSLNNATLAITLVIKLELGADGSSPISTQGIKMQLMMKNSEK
jgi:hypothetical protein